MSLDISVNSTNYLPQAYSNIFNQSFDSFKISYVLLLGVVVMVYILIFAVFGNSTGTSGPIMIVIEIILWVVLILVIGVNVKNYDYSFSLKNLFNSNNAELDVNVNKNISDISYCKPTRDPNGCEIIQDKTKDDLLLEWLEIAQSNQPDLKKQFEKFLITEEIKLVDPKLGIEFEKFFKEKEKKNNEEEKKKIFEENQLNQIFKIIAVSLLVSLFFSTIVSFIGGITFGIIVFFVVVFIFYVSVYFTGYLDKLLIDYDSTKDSCDDSNGEVFHIPNNKHSFEKARSICSKYNARLATYSEVEAAYNNGANWCSYGWSEDQLALFPTQLDIYNNLKLIPGHENDCGRPGVNGGFIDNANVKFGVNCFGTKPEQTKEDIEYMERLKLSYSPIIDQDELDKIAKDKDNMLIAPFNKDKWSIQ